MTAAPRWMRITARLLVAAIIIGEAYPQIASVMRGTPVHLFKNEDDAYYYFNVARHIYAQGAQGIPSFDGITRTNGFQPLWQIVVTALVFVCGGVGKAFFIALTLIETASAVAAFELFMLLGCDLFGDRRISKNSGMPEITAAGISIASLVVSLFVYVNTVVMAFNGMETVVGIPIYLCTIVVLVRLEGIHDVQPRKILFVGLLCSLLVLSRLDTALFILILLAGWMAHGIRRNVGPRRMAREIALFCAGGILVPAYLFWNVREFGDIFPVSMLAKELHCGGGFNIRFLRSMASSRHMYGLFFWLVVPLAMVALGTRKGGIFGGGDTAVERKREFVRMLSIVFPACAYLLIDYFSDWYLFSWYLYALPMAVYVALMAIETEWIAPRLSVRFARAAGIAVFMAVALYVAVRGALLIPFNSSHFNMTGERSIYTHALKIRGFAMRHPGVYAMGDRSGLTGFLMPYPVIQLEGIAADGRMVEHIRRGDDLNAVLAEYGVDYLIVTISDSLPYMNGCFEDVEPNRTQAGSNSCAMKGKLCNKLALEFFTADDRNRTYIFPVSAKAIALCTVAP